MASSHVDVPSDVLPELRPIPEAERKGKPIDIFWIWSGANIAVTNWAIGTIPIALGLSLKDTIWLIILGNAIGAAFFAMTNHMGKATALGQMVLGRTTFGIRGSNLASLMQFVLCVGWLGVNSYFAVMAMSKILAIAGLAPTVTGNIIIAVVVFLAEVLIGVYGFYVIKNTDRYIVPLMAILLAVMTYIAFTHGAKWDYAGKPDGLPRLVALAISMGVCGMGWGISWTTWSGDYSRYLPKTASSGKTFGWAFLGMYLCTAWLGILGAVIAASYGTSSDPAEMVTAIVPGFAIPALLLIFLAVVSTNGLNVNSSYLSAITMGLKWGRPTAGAVAGVIGFAVCVVGIFVANVAAMMDQWMLTLLVWMTPWMATVLVDFFIIKKQNINVSEIYKPANKSIYGDINWKAIAAWMIGLIAGYLFGSTPLFTGPFAKMLGGADLSWIVGIVVAGGLEWLFHLPEISKAAGQKAAAGA